MQRRYKGKEIPTFDEIIETRNKYIKEHPNEAVPANLTVEIDGISVIICSLEDAQKIKEEEGTKGINKKIDDTIVDFVDNVLDSALTMTDAVKNMTDEVKKDPSKVLKNFYKNTVPTAGKEIEIREDGTYEDISSASKKYEENNKEEEVETSKTLTDKEVNLLIRKTEEIAANNPDVQKLRDIKNNPPEKEEGESKKLLVNVDPNTGENRIVGDAENYLGDDETFEEMYERIKNSDIDFNASSPLTKEEVITFLSDKNNKFLVQDLIEDNDVDIDAETLQGLLSVANRRIAKEEFNVYKELPEKIRDMIDKYTLSMGISLIDKRSKVFKKQVSEALLDDFISNINMDRIKHDFSVELEGIFNKASEEISEEIVGYSELKIAKYREAVEKMEDPAKKEKLTNILNNIQEAYDLNTLKEFAKKCKIKKFDLEKPRRVFNNFTSKYKDSPYTIYSIDMVRPIVFRNINKDEEEFSDDDVNAFFIAFCRQTQAMSPDNPIEHAYMYYVIYNIVLSDINKSEKTKNISEKFMENVKEVIHNLKERNPNVLK
jgi:hypothetical protein